MINTNLRFLISALLLFVGACGGGGGSGPVTTPPVPPTAYNYMPPADIGDSWTIGGAADSGFDVSVLEDMMNDIRGGRFGFIDSVAIARNGVLVFDETIRQATDREDGLVGNTDLTMHRQFSVSKSVTSLIVGIAIDEGHISNVAVPFLDLFSYPSYLNWDDRKNDMTLADVLAMRSGLAWNEWDPPYSDPNNQLINFYGNHVDYAKGLLDLPMAADPDSVFAYNTIASVALGQAVENSIPLALVDFGLNELMLPLGITDVEVLTTPTGLPNGGAGFYFRTRDIAKFGQVTLSGGLWNGERIVSESWINESMTSRSGRAWIDPANWDWQVEGYGYQWWTGFYDHNGTQLDTWVAWGFGGQWIIVIPALDMVVAINSHGYLGEDEATNQGHTLVRQYILDSVTN
jgi:CubicO group peptidase (beta-lactamase class C family)